MSAREKIAELLWRVVPSRDDAEAAATAEQMLDAYAHELAEKLRNHDENDGSFNYAAALIDPEVER